jgi:hypothetical protein
MPKYRKLLSAAEKHKDVILIETDGHILVDDRSQVKNL